MQNFNVQKQTNNVPGSYFCSSDMSGTFDVYLMSLEVEGVGLGCGARVDYTGIWSVLNFHFSEGELICSLTFLHRMSSFSLLMDDWSEHCRVEQRQNCLLKGLWVKPLAPLSHPDAQFRASIFMILQL